MKDYVYIIEFEPNLVKVGKSCRPDVRIKGVSSASGRLVKREWVSPPLINASELELATHKKLAKHRGHGEWFNCSLKSAIDAVNACIDEKMLWTEDRYRAACKKSDESAEKLISLFRKAYEAAADKAKQDNLQAFKKSLLERAIKNYLVFFELNDLLEKEGIHIFEKVRGQVGKGADSDLCVALTIADEEYQSALMKVHLSLGAIAETCSMLAETGDPKRIAETMDVIEVMAKERYAA